MNFATQPLTASYISSIMEECKNKSDECDSFASEEWCNQGCASCSARGATVHFWVNLDRVGKVLTKAQGDQSQLYGDRTGVYTGNPYYKGGNKVFRIHADNKGNLSYKEV